MAEDQFGGVFRHDIRAAGVTYDTPQETERPPIARSLIFVTPDAQRTMQTYLGACLNLTPADVEPDTIKGSKVIYLEGYPGIRRRRRRPFCRPPASPMVSTARWR